MTTEPAPRVSPGPPYAVHAAEYDRHGLLREATVCGRRIPDDWITLSHTHQLTCETCIEAELGEIAFDRRQTYRERELRWTSA